MSGRIKPKKVCLVIPTLDFGGAERVFVELANAFVAEGHIVSLVVLTKAGAFVDRVHPAVNLVLLYKTSLLYSLTRLLRELHRIKPQVVIATLIHLNIVVGLCRRVGLLSCETLLLREASIPSLVANRSIKTKFLAWLYRAAYMCADCVVAQSEFMKRDIQKTFYIDTDRIRVIYNPVDLERVRGLADAPISFSRETKTIVFVGRLSAEKQVEHILRAIALPSLNQVTLHIVGDGDQREFIDSEVRLLNLSDRVVFHGAQANPFPYMKQADLVVLSSAFEGFPNVLIEAIAVGTPICSYRCPGGTGEIICADNGLLVDPCTPEALSKAIGSLLNTPPAVEKIQSTVSLFQTKRIVDQYTALF